MLLQPPEFQDDPENKLLTAVYKIAHKDEFCTEFEFFVTESESVREKIGFKEKSGATIVLKNVIFH